MKRNTAFTFLFAEFILRLVFGGIALASTPEPLFIIERSINSNELWYTPRLLGRNNFDRNEPVTAYWIMKAEDGHKEDLTWFEKEHAYGFSIRQEDGKPMILTIKAMEKIPLRLVIADGVPRAETTIAGRKAYLKKVYVKVSSGLIPGIDSVTLSGEDSATGSKLETTLQP